MAKTESELDWKKIDNLLIAGCHGTQVAEQIGIHYNTLYRRISEKYNCEYSEYLRQKRSHGDNILRAKQFEKAVSGDNMMLIWLGKNRLKQSDNQQQEQSVNDAAIGEKLELAKLKAENAELKRILNESKAGTEHIPSQQTPEHLVRSGQERQDI